jgi:hypothetical protein
MSILDTIMGAVGGSAGQAIEQRVAGMIADKMGIDPSMAKMAIDALAKNHTLPNDTVSTAAQETGVSGDIMSQILGHIGGEGALGSLVSQMGGAAAGGGKQAGGGDIAGALTGMLGGLMGGTKN